MKVSIEYLGIDLEVEYDYKSEQKETRLDEYCPDSFTIESVKLHNSGICILELLSEYAKEDIENEIRKY